MTSTFGCLESLNCPMCSPLPPPAGTGWCVSAGPSIQEADRLFQSWCPSWATNWRTERRRWAASTRPTWFISLSVSDPSLPPSASSTITCWSRRSVSTPMRRPPRPLLRWRRRTWTRRLTNILNYVRPRRAKSWRPAQRRRSCWSLMHSNAETSCPFNHIGGFYTFFRVKAWILLPDVSESECSGPSVNTLQVYNGDFTFFLTLFWIYKEIYFFTTECQMFLVLSSYFLSTIYKLYFYSFL